MGNSDKVYVTGQSGDSATLRNFFGASDFRVGRFIEELTPAA
jgi:hypothetical protein